MNAVAYPPPVDKLLTGGDLRGTSEWHDYRALGLGPEHVPDLIRMATDHELNWADGDSPDVWAPVHAWRALGQLRAEEALEPLLGVFAELEDSDWFNEDMPDVFAAIGPAAIPALAAYLGDQSHETWPRVTTTVCLERMGERHPETRDACIAALTASLEHFAENDPSLNAFLISPLLKLRAVEAAPVIERAFAADRVDLSVTGDWEDAQVELGLLAARATPRPNYLRAMFPALDLDALGFDAAPTAADTAREYLPDPQVAARNAAAKAKAKAKNRTKMAKQSRRKSRKRK